MSSEKESGADNQQERLEKGISKEILGTILREIYEDAQGWVERIQNGEINADFEGETRTEIELDHTYQVITDIADRIKTLTGIELDLNDIFSEPSETTRQEP